MPGLYHKSIKLSKTLQKMNVITKNKKAISKPKTNEWLKEKAKEITKFNGFDSAPNLIQIHFIKMVKIYLNSNGINEISAKKFNEILPSLWLKDCHKILVSLNKEVFAKK